MANTPGKFNMRWEGPYKVIERKGDVTYKLLHVENQTEYVTHVDRMKPFTNETASNPATAEQETNVEPDTEKGPVTESEQPIQPEQTEPSSRRKKQVRSHSLDRPPVETRYGLRKTIELPAKLKDYHL